MDTPENDRSRSVLCGIDALCRGMHTGRYMTLPMGRIQTEGGLLSADAAFYECLAYCKTQHKAHKDLIVPANLHHPQCVNPASTWNDPSDTREACSSTPSIVSVFSGSYNEQHPEDALPMIELEAFAKDGKDVEPDAGSVSPNIPDISSIDCSVTAYTDTRAVKMAPDDHALPAPAHASISMAPSVNGTDDDDSDGESAYDGDSSCAYDTDHVVRRAQRKSRIQARRNGRGRGGRGRHAKRKAITIMACHNHCCAPPSYKNHDVPSLSLEVGSSSYTSSVSTPCDTSVATPIIRDSNSPGVFASTSPVVSSSNLSVPAFTSSSTAPSAKTSVYGDYTISANGLIVSNHGTGYRRYGRIIVKGDSIEYECSCNHRTKTPGDMTRHWQSRLHSAPEFKCEGCQRRYTRSDALKRHLRAKQECRAKMPETG
ncbi:hypothetical protein AX17_002774 [Amanita inopinata Kibby_2008]|nr:hypothetical protein AX17_002774 [Amanita inopinata Kibby_2008]